MPEAQPEADCECDDETLGEDDSVPLTEAQADELKDADNVEDAQPDTVGDDDTDTAALRVPVEQGLGDLDGVPHCDTLRVKEGVAVTQGVAVSDGEREGDALLDKLVVPVWVPLTLSVAVLQPETDTETVMVGERAADCDPDGDCVDVA